MQFVSSNKIATSKMCAIMGSFLAVTKFESVEGVQVQADIARGIVTACQLTGLVASVAKDSVDYDGSDGYIPRGTEVVVKMDMDRTLQNCVRNGSVVRISNEYSNLFVVVHKNKDANIWLIQELTGLPSKSGAVWKPKVAKYTKRIDFTRCLHERVGSVDKVHEKFGFQKGDVVRVQNEDENESSAAPWYNPFHQVKQFGRYLNSHIKQHKRGDVGTVVALTSQSIFRGIDRQVVIQLKGRGNVMFSKSYQNVILVHRYQEGDRVVVTSDDYHDQSGRVMKIIAKGLIGLPQLRIRIDNNGPVIRKQMKHVELVKKATKEFQQAPSPQQANEEPQKEQIQRQATEHDSHRGEDGDTDFLNGVAYFSDSDH